MTDTHEDSKPGGKEEKDPKERTSEAVEKGRPRKVNPLAPPINNQPGS